MITVKIKQSFMKSLLSIALTFSFLLLVASCNSGAEKTEPAAATTDTVAEVKQEPVNYLYPSTYPSDWKIGDPQKIVKVQELYKVLLSDSNYESVLPLFADSITNITFDNRKLKLSAADFIATAKKLRKGFKTLDEEFKNYVSLRSDAQNADMVMLWLKEKGTRLNGKVDSSGYQETWRFNSQGKIDYRSIFVRYDY
jgi:hypothetical protein